MNKVKRKTAFIYVIGIILVGIGAYYELKSLNNPASKSRVDPELFNKCFETYKEPYLDDIFLISASDSSNTYKENELKELEIEFKNRIKNCTVLLEEKAIDSILDALNK